MFAHLCDFLFHLDLCIYNQYKLNFQHFKTQVIRNICLSFPVYCEGDVIAMEDIYYDLNKFNIRPDAAKVLDKLLKLMKDYPKMQIELRSHTDARGSAESNRTLSNNRARTAAEYLYSKGIQKGRIIGKGYGETILINKCADGVPCSEAEHQLNRRTEFKILKME